jgi:heme/copper-type cytochrome/quinol oxidase subunit 2
VKVTVRSEDVAYSVTIDEYRVSKRVPAGGTTTLEFRADRAGTFAFYSNLTSDSRHNSTKGQLVVRPR